MQGFPRTKSTAGAAPHKLCKPALRAWALRRSAGASPAADPVITRTRLEGGAGSNREFPHLPPRASTPLRSVFSFVVPRTSTGGPTTTESASARDALRTLRTPGRAQRATLEVPAKALYYRRPAHQQAPHPHNYQAGRPRRPHAASEPCLRCARRNVLYQLQIFRLGQPRKQAREV